MPTENFENDLLSLISHKNGEKPIQVCLDNRSAFPDGETEPCASNKFEEIANNNMNVILLKMIPGEKLNIGKELDYREGR